MIKTEVENRHRAIITDFEYSIEKLEELRSKVNKEDVESGGYNSEALQYRLDSIDNEIIYYIEKVKNQYLHIRIEELTNKLKRNNMEELEQMLKSFDWHYQRSDDHSKYKHGLKQFKELCDKMNELGHTKEVKGLYERYCPYNK